MKCAFYPIGNGAIAALLDTASCLAVTCFQIVPHEGTAIPRLTAGRAPIASNQRFTLDHALRSVLCHSWRATQGYVAMSAIEYSPARYSASPKRRSSTP